MFIISGSSFLVGEVSRFVVEDEVKRLFAFMQPVSNLMIIYQARALRALGLLLADGTPTVGGGKTF